MRSSRKMTLTEVVNFSISASSFASEINRREVTTVLITAVSQTEIMPAEPMEKLIIAGTRLYSCNPRITFNVLVELGSKTPIVSVSLVNRLSRFPTIKVRVISAL